MIEFKAWPKIPRVENRKEFYTEKLDGTNACIILSYASGVIPPMAGFVTEVGVLNIWAQSRRRFIAPEDDNYGFAKWVYNNSDELAKLGEGYHYGEWWGAGIGRGYGQTAKKFSLFNTKQWGEHNPNTPACCNVVPSIHADNVEEAKRKLIEGGSLAAPGFMNPEGVIVFEYQTESYWKAIINK